MLGVGAQSPHQEGRHDDQVVQREPLVVSQYQPLRAADAHYSKCEGDLVDHLDPRMLQSPFNVIHN